MKWRAWSILLTLVVVSLLALAVPASGQGQLAPAEITGKAVYVPFPVAIKIDGDVKDWDGVPVTKVARGKTLSPKPEEKGSFSFSVAADDTSFYILMTMLDKSIITGKHGTDFWNEDSMEFYLNFSGDLTATAYTPQIYQINVNPGDIGKKTLTLSGTNINVIKDKVTGVVFKTDDGWGFEAAVPLPFKPEHGKIFGFQAHTNGATEKDRDVKLIWSLADTGDTSYQDPSVFGQAILFQVGSKDVPTPVAIVAKASPTPTPVPVPKARAFVAVNQVGYFTSQPKRAVFAVEKALSTTPTWLLKDAGTGAMVASSTAADGVMDNASGDTVYVVDFSYIQAPGTYVLSVGGLDSAPFKIGSDIYGDLRKDSIAYFYRDRSGIAIEEKYAGKTWARPAGHLSDSSVTCYKGTDTSGKSWDGCPYQLDGSGGWYDAGDYGKYVVNGGITEWTLVNWYEHSPASFPDGSLKLPENSNKWPDILDEARWEMDFMLRMQVPEGQPLAGMAHHKLHSTTWDPVPAPLPEKADNRFLMPPSTAATLNLAATAAQCARVWKPFDAAFAQRCLTAAETAWKAALAHPDMLYGSIPGAGGGDYGDNNVTDEFFWAAAELYITTGNTVYSDYLKQSPYYTQFYGLKADAISAMGWGDTSVLGVISLVTVQNGLPKEDLDRFRKQIVQTADRYVATIKGEGYSVSVGASQYVWGSNSTVLNNAVILALAYDYTKETQYLNGVIESMNYILGRNAINQSFVTGYGQNAAQHPHHRLWANQPDRGFPAPPPGVVVGGPNGTPADPTAIDKVSKVPPARRYLDDIESYSTNEVAINWNAPLVWVSSYLDGLFNK